MTKEQLLIDFLRDYNLLDEELCVLDGSVTTHAGMICYTTIDAFGNLVGNQRIEELEVTAWVYSKITALSKALGS